jgi:hypothetical protein
MIKALEICRATLAAEPVMEGPSDRIVSIAKAVQECAFAHKSDTRLIGNVCAEDVADLCDAVIARWARPAAPAAPEPGEVGELVAQLEEDGKRLIAAGYANASVETRDLGIRVTRAATLLQRLSAPAPAVVPVAVEALARLYWWGGMRQDYGYSADVVTGVRDWIDGGMVGGLPPLSAWVADRCPPLPFPAAPAPAVVPVAKALAARTVAAVEICHGHRDGECHWDQCPQLRDSEPAATGRSCPLPLDPDDIERAASPAALAAEPVGEGPSDEEIIIQAGNFLAYCDAHMGDPARWEGSDADLLAFARAILARRGHPTAVGR